MGGVKPQGWQSTFTVLGFPTLEAAKEFLDYLRRNNLSRVHSLMLAPKYLDCNREVWVWGLPDAILQRLVQEADPPQQRTAMPVQVERAWVLADRD